MAATSSLAMFAREMKTARGSAGLTQEQLAERISYSGSLVAMVESCRRPPSLDFARRCDEALETGGLLARLSEYVSSEAHPSWFREWVEIEREASWLRWVEPLLVPGLLQTEGYARAILSVRPEDGDEDIDAAVAARLERQAILDRENPPRLWCVIDESVVHRSIGGPKVMAGQLEHLTEMAERPKISIEIIPATAGAHPCLLGAFILADTEAGARTLYLETAVSAQVTEAPAIVRQAALTYETVRSEALPAAASADLIRKAQEQWT